MLLRPPARTTTAASICSSLFTGALLLCAVLTTPVTAQTGSIRVEVADSASGARLTATGVAVLNGDGAPIASATTDRLGRALLLDVPSGSHVIELTRFGYEAARRSVQVGPGVEPALVEVRLQASAFSLDAVLVTATRASETTLATPAAVSVISRDEIERRTVLSPIDLIADQPGTQVVTGGLMQRAYTSRGNNFGTSSQMLALTDYRYSVLPSLNINLAYSLATNDADIERVEQVRGPAGALYGPNTSRGVMHIITRSPFDAPGTSVSVTAGGRSVVQSQVRHAAKINDRLAFKVSGRFLRGNDWEVIDPAEVAARDALIAGGADPSTVKVGARDFGISVTGGEGVLEWRGSDGTTLTTNLGLTHIGNAFDALTFGQGAQLTDFSIGYAQLRLSQGRFFANAFASGIRGDSVHLTGNGIRLADGSITYVAQLQHGIDLGRRAALTYGGEATHIDSETYGTTHTFTEDRDNLSTVDAYGHASFALSPTLDISAAARASYHSIFENVVVTPNLGVVHRPAPGHAIRATFARAAFSPSSGIAFMDFPVASLGPYNLRLTERYVAQTFRRDCGGLCMRSPFAADPNAFLPTDATVGWPALVAQLQAAGVDLSGVTAPTSADVASILARLNLDTFGFDPVTAGDVQDVPTLRRLTQNTFEIGYKGVFEDRLSVTADLHYNDMGPVWAVQFIGTPSVFFDATSLEGYLLGQGVAPADAAQAAAVAAALPVGTVTPEQAGDPHALMLFEPQGGEAKFFGMDLGAIAHLTDSWRTSASYSWISKDMVPDINGTTDFLFFNPKHRGALSVDYHDPSRSIDIGLRSRFVGSYPAVDFLSQSEAEAFWVVDARVGYRVRDDLTLSLAVDNVLNNEFAEMPGLPVMGRLILVRAQVEF